jgi:hypothetical protein
MDRRVVRFLGIHRPSAAPSHCNASANDMHRREAASRQQLRLEVQPDAEARLIGLTAHKHSMALSNVPAALKLEERSGVNGGLGRSKVALRSTVRAFNPHSRCVSI